MKQLPALVLITLLLWFTGCKTSRHPGRTYAASSADQPSAVPNGRSAEPGVRVLDILLDDQYTILYMTFVDRDRLQSGPKPTIAAEPGGKLIAANGARTFRFIKAEGIPVKPETLETTTGDRIDFVLYFERLDKGIDRFDLFQCNDTDQAVCWNIYDLRVDNPADPTPELPATAPADAALAVTGTVRNASTDRPVSATIDYKRSGHRVSVDSVQSFATTGAYRLTLDRGRYTYVASARGYRTSSGTLDLREATPGQSFTRDIRLTPLAVGDKIELKNIYFEMSKSDLLSASFAELNQVMTLMQDNPQMRIRLEGHTDIIGDHDQNRRLSKDRVGACRDYLVQQGINRHRIDAVGYGDTRPIRTQGTDEERKINRRVEFVILTL